MKSQNSRAAGDLVDDTHFQFLLSLIENDRGQIFFLTRSGGRAGELFSSLIDFFRLYLISTKQGMV